MRHPSLTITAVGFLALAGQAANTATVAPLQAAAEEKQMAVPSTPEEHLARAAMYREKAAAYRQEAALHRKMFADYERQRDQPALRVKLSRELPWIAKMRKHCDEYTREAERLAAAADRFAEHHTMHAEEMRGN